MGNKKLQRKVAAAAAAARLREKAADINGEKKIQSATSIDDEWFWELIDAEVKRRIGFDVMIRTVLMAMKAAFDEWTQIEDPEAAKKFVDERETLWTLQIVAKKTKTTPRELWERTKRVMAVTEQDGRDRVEGEAAQKRAREFVSHEFNLTVPERQFTMWNFVNFEMTVDKFREPDDECFAIVDHTSDPSLAGWLHDKQAEQYKKTFYIIPFLVPERKNFVATLLTWREEIERFKQVEMLATMHGDVRNLHLLRDTYKLDPDPKHPNNSCLTHVFVWDARCKQWQMQELSNKTFTHPVFLRDLMRRVQDDCAVCLEAKPGTPTEYCIKCKKGCCVGCIPTSQTWCPSCRQPDAFARCRKCKQVTSHRNTLCSACRPENWQELLRTLRSIGLDSEAENTSPAKH